jgi:hypothetical protein
MALPPDLAQAFRNRNLKPEGHRLSHSDLQAQIDEYLKQGGKIRHLPDNASALSDEPVKRKRRDQVQHMKKRRAT